MALVDRHTGIYFHVVRRYAAAYPNAIKVPEMDDDKLFNLYQFILAYDPARGMKLCSYIGDRTDYLCKTMLKRDARDPISQGNPSVDGYLASGAPHQSAPVLMDESPGAHVVDTANTDLALEDIRATAARVCHDARFPAIFDCRHGASAMSWREVGERVGLSHEGARKVYNHNLALVKAHLSP